MSDPIRRLFASSHPPASHSGNQSATSSLAGTLGQMQQATCNRLMSNHFRANPSRAGSAAPVVYLFSALASLQILLAVGFRFLALWLCNLVGHTQPAIDLVWLFLNKQGCRNQNLNLRKINLCKENSTHRNARVVDGQSHENPADYVDTD